METIIIRRSRRIYQLYNVIYSYLFYMQHLIGADALSYDQMNTANFVLVVSCYWKISIPE